MVPVTRRRRTVVGAATAVAAVAGILGVEALLVVRRDFLGADDAPPLTTTMSGPADGRPLRLAILGDSTAAGVGVTRTEDSVAARLAADAARAGRRVALVPLGVSGARAADLAGQVDAALTSPPDVAVVLVGANDSTHLTGLGSIRRDLRAAVAELRAAGVEVVVGTCPDMGTATAFARPLRDVVAWSGRRVAAAERKAVLDAGGRPVDIGAETGPAFRADPDRYLSEDEFHPSADGYALWTEALLPAFHAALAAAG